MSFWRKLFGKTGPGKGSETQSKSVPATDPTRLKCPFCGALELTADETDEYAYHVWKCTCGSVAASGWLADLDEVGDQLLKMLRIDERVSEPPVPTDNPAISLHHYDVDNVETELPKILSRHGYWFIAMDWTGEGVKERVFWAKPRESTA